MVPASVYKPIGIEAILDAANLRTRAPSSDKACVFVQSETADSLGGKWFYWDNQSTTSDDGETVFKVVDITTGRWKRPSGSIQKRSLTATHATITAAAGDETLSIGAALPANSRILGVSIHTVTAFSGGTVGDFTVDIGSAGDIDALVDGANLFAAAVDGQVATRPLGIAPNKFFAAATQLQAKFICGSDDVGDATAGACTIDVLFEVLP